MKYQLITISGQLGSGKSTIAQIIAKTLGWKYYSTGMAQRKIAEERGISSLELNKIAETDSRIDQEIDGIYQNRPWGNQPCVIDSRLAFYFLPESFKVKLKADSQKAAERVFLANRSKEKYPSIPETEKALKARALLEKNRFQKIYHIDISDDTLFDLVLDTTDTTPQEIAQKIIDRL